MEAGDQRFLLSGLDVREQISRLANKKGAKVDWMVKLWW